MAQPVAEFVPRVTHYEHSHISISNAIGTKDTELTDQMIAFMKVAKPTN